MKISKERLKTEKKNTRRNMDPNDIGITIAIGIVIVVGIAACTLTILYGIGAI